MFAVKRHGLLEDFVYFRALCGVQSRICAESGDCLGSATVVGTGGETLCFRFTFS